MSPSGADRDAIRSLLAMVRGVESVEVTGSNGSLEAIEVAIGAGQSEGRVVRDVESALASGLDLEIDHGKIQVVPTGAPAGSGPGSRDLYAELGLERPEGSGAVETAPRTPRLRLVDVRTEESPDTPHCAVTVVVAHGETRVTGRVRDADTPRGRVLSAARAALLAVEETIDGATAFLMEGIEEFTINDLPGLIAHVRTRRERESRSMFGCALVDTHLTEAAAKAALDAVNRFWDAQARVRSIDPDDRGKETG